VHADPQLGECSGILHADRDSIIVGGDEGEGICVINKSQENTVLSKCRIGQFCRIKGVVDTCKESGECSEVLRVTSADQMNPAEHQTEPKTTLWYHNGSLVYLVVEGPSRKFYYKEPREEMLAVGARLGSLLFSGKSNGKKYVGTAYIFNARCGQVPYRVTGPILDNFKRVILRGQAPRNQRFTFDISTSDEWRAILHTCTKGTAIRPARVRSGRAFFYGDQRTSQACQNMWTVGAVEFE
jgi:hypothetical protein